MSISPVPVWSTTLTNVGQSTGQTGSASHATGGGSFSNLISSALQGVNSSLTQADSLASAYATGNNVSIEQLMLAEQKASISVDAVTAVQKQVVQSYQAMMNMQV